MKRSVFLILLLVCLWPVSVQAVELDLEAPSALLMEKSTGQVLYAQNEHQKLEPASVTKVMTLLLTMEAIEKGAIGYDDVVTVSAYAASMGGSNVYLAEGEKITVEDLLKAVCVASGNDAAVTIAEGIAGTEEAFVQRMNEKAKELDLQNTVFTNATGFYDENQYSTARDVAIIGRKVLENNDYVKMSKVYMY